MAISRFKTSTLAQGLPKYTEIWDQTTTYSAPPPVGGYKLWLDASDASTITSSAGAVSQWTDKSTNTYAFVQATSTNQPTTGTRTINGKNALDFDGTNDKLQSNSAASTWNFLHNATNATVFMVISPDTSQDQPLLTTSNDSTQVGIWYYLRTSGTSFGMAILNGTSNNFVALEYGSSYQANTPMVATFALDADNGTPANRIRFYKNSGTEEGTFQESTQSFTTSNAAASLVIGAWPASNAYNGLIGEIIAYEGILSDANRNSVSDYLKTKWGI